MYVYPEWLNSIVWGKFIWNTHHSAKCQHARILSYATSFKDSTVGDFTSRPGDSWGNDQSLRSSWKTTIKWILPRWKQIHVLWPPMVASGGSVRVERSCKSSNRDSIICFYEGFCTQLRGFVHNKLPVHMCSFPYHSRTSREPLCGFLWRFNTYSFFTR